MIYRRGTIGSPLLARCVHRRPLISDNEGTVSLVRENRHATRANVGHHLVKRRMFVRRTLVARVCYVVIASYLANAVRNGVLCADRSFVVATRVLSLVAACRNLHGNYSRGQIFAITLKRAPPANVATGVRRQARYPTGAINTKLGNYGAYQFFGHLRVPYAQRSREGKGRHFVSVGGVRAGWREGARAAFFGHLLLCVTSAFRTFRVRGPTRFANAGAFNRVAAFDLANHGLANGQRVRLACFLFRNRLLRWVISRAVRVSQEFLHVHADNDGRRRSWG